MFKYYSKATPENDDIVIGIITEIDTTLNIIKCILPEYGGITGLVCKINLGKRQKHLLKNRRVGELYPFQYENIQVTDGESQIDLRFMIMTDEQIENYKGKYNRINKIINGFLWIISSNDEKYKDISYDDLVELPEIKTTIDQILVEAVHPYANSITADDQHGPNQPDRPLEQIYNLYYKNVPLLHLNEVPQWTFCNSIPMFREKMIIKYPFPNYDMNVKINIQTTMANGIQFIKRFFRNINQYFVEQLGCSEEDLSIVSIPIKAPNYSFNLKSDIIKFDNQQTFIDILENYIKSYTDLDNYNIKVVSCEFNY